MNTFQDDIKNLIPTNIDSARATIATGERAIYFIGRETCPYCRRFATKLGKVVSETGATIYFVNSQEQGQLEALADFRSQYNIPTVPGFVRISQGQVTVRCDSGMTEDEIKAFIVA
ncbi:putative bacteriocin transport accessory protein [Streptococcus rupicaprae]|uniref:Bacteriocin transport accessory protein n=2 Tax=Streptococcus rupicaprae TaxID=759619 RepID=A0ABV2FFC3_9STRE